VAAPPAPELRRELTDTAHCSVDEHPLAGCQTPVDEEALPGAERREWDRGALYVAERCRLRRQELGRDGSVFGRNPVAVERSKRVHLVVDRDLGDVVCGRDHTGQLV
jgi:hypothetical protein